MLHYFVDNLVIRTSSCCMVDLQASVHAHALAIHARLCRLNCWEGIGYGDLSNVDILSALHAGLIN